MKIKIARSRKNPYRYIHISITGEDRWRIAPWSFSRFLGARLSEYLNSGGHNTAFTVNDHRMDTYLITIDFTREKVTPDIIDFITSQTVAWKMMDRGAKKKAL